MFYRSVAEQLMAQHLKEHHIKFEHDYKFAPPRRYLLDFALIDHKIGIEIEGISPSNTRHQRFTGYMKDCEKYNLALEKGWKLIRIPTPWLFSKKYGNNFRSSLELIKKLIT